MRARASMWGCRYLLKAYVLLGDEEYLEIFHEAYAAAELHLRRDPW